MAVRQISVLQHHEYRGTLADFRETLVKVKEGSYPDLSDEELSYTREEADDFCNKVRLQAGLPDLPRTFILRSLVGVRKHPIRA